MSSGKPPEGWDEPDEATIQLSRAFRTFYVSLITAGFTMQEACAILGAIFAANGAAGSST